LIEIAFAGGRGENQLWVLIRSSERRCLVGACQCEMRSNAKGAAGNGGIEQEATTIDTQD
jgi:hypothetical protein